MNCSAFRDVPGRWCSFAFKWGAIRSGLLHSRSEKRDRRRLGEIKVGRLKRKEKEMTGKFGRKFRINADQLKRISNFLLSPKTSNFAQT